ncbi:MAG: glucose-6-phosphate isomerase [Spirochaetaceae bacterium]|jgi:glucose-6-phosphate isomerase|nr:glucose-6-phosphate isomerase [Spirochaetaceae bacterium]
MKFTDFDKTQAYKALQTFFPPETGGTEGGHLTKARIEQSSIPMAGGLHYNYAAKGVQPGLLPLLQALADEQELIAKYKALVAGEVMNTGEKREVLHQQARSVFDDDKPVPQRKDYIEQLAKFSAFADKVHAGSVQGSTGKAFTDVCQIGIGGSDLGPRALYIALENMCPKKMKAHFISNVDPDDPSAVLAGLPLETSLFVLVSKSGTTLETLTNEIFVKTKLKEAGLDPKKHFIAVTSETSPLAHNSDYLDAFYMDDYIGGRYSSSSAVGGVILSLAFGPAVFKQILKGAHEADKLAFESDISKNAALLDALLGIWERNFCGYAATAVLPYSQALSRFPAHLQQLDMESNGKRVNREGKAIAYKTGPLVFGEPGTNGQHSFYQLLHQGTDIIPLQFIGFTESQRKDDVVVEGSNSQAKLKANLAAQIVAFYNGQSVDGDNKNKEFPGGRPSSLIYGKQLTPETLGALLAHFENKVMFQGFVWNINSFDQEGVQLGKTLAKKVLGGNSGNEALEAYSGLLGVLL